MALDDVTAEGVERAMVEFDRLGREAFLSPQAYAPDNPVARRLYPSCGTKAAGRQ